MQLIIMPIFLKKTWQCFYYVPVGDVLVHILTPVTHICRLICLQTLVWDWNWQAILWIQPFVQWELGSNSLFSQHTEWLPPLHLALWQVAVTAALFCTEITFIVLASSGRWWMRTGHAQYSCSATPVAVLRILIRTWVQCHHGWLLVNVRAQNRMTFS